MSGIKITEEAQAGRPYGTTREEFRAACEGKMDDWLLDAETKYGLLERIASITLKDGRVLLLGRFAQAWLINFHHPGNPKTEQDLQCFLSLEGMIGFWGLYEYLTTQQTNEQAWAAFMAVLPREDEEENANV